MTQEAEYGQNKGRAAGCGADDTPVLQEEGGQQGDVQSDALGQAENDSASPGCRHQFVKRIYLTDCLQQQKEGAERHIARCSILKLMNGRDCNSRLFRYLFLRHIATQTVILESCTKKFIPV